MVSIAEMASRFCADNDVTQIITVVEKHQDHQLKKTKKLRRCTDGGRLTGRLDSQNEPWKSPRTKKHISRIDKYRFKLDECVNLYLSIKRSNSGTHTNVALMNLLVVKLSRVLEWMKTKTPKFDNNCLRHTFRLVEAMCFQSVRKKSYYPDEVTGEIVDSSDLVPEQNLLGKIANSAIEVMKTFMVLATNLYTEFYIMASDDEYSVSFISKLVSSLGYYCVQDSTPSNVLLLYNIYTKVIPLRLEIRQLLYGVILENIMSGPSLANFSAGREALFILKLIIGGFRSPVAKEHADTIPNLLCGALNNSTHSPSFYTTAIVSCIKKYIAVDVEMKMLRLIIVSWPRNQVANLYIQMVSKLLHSKNFNIPDDIAGSILDNIIDALGSELIETVVSALNFIEAEVRKPGYGILYLRSKALGSAIYALLENTWCEDVIGSARSILYNNFTITNPFDRNLSGKQVTPRFCLKNIDDDDPFGFCASSVPFKCGSMNSLLDDNTQHERHARIPGHQTNPHNQGDTVFPCMSRSKDRKPNSNEHSPNHGTNSPKGFGINCFGCSSNGHSNSARSGSNTSASGGGHTIPLHSPRSLRCIDDATTAKYSYIRYLPLNERLELYNKYWQTVSELVGVNPKAYFGDLHSTPRSFALLSNKPPTHNPKEIRSASTLW